MLPSRELKSGGVIEDLSLRGLSEKPVHGSRCAPNHNDEEKGTSVGVFLAGFQLNAFSVGSICLQCPLSSITSEDFKRYFLSCFT